MRRSFAGPLVLVAAAITTAHCHGGEIDLPVSKATPAPSVSSAPQTGIASVGDAVYSVRVTDTPPSLTLLRGDTTLVVLSADALQLGTVTALNDDFNYDPYFMALGQHAKDPDGLSFVSPTSAKLVSTSPATLALTYPGGTATLTVTATAAGSFALKLVPSMPNVAYFRLRPRVDAKEGFYGLGEQFDEVNNRGQIRPMQLETGSPLESGYTLTHVPIPFVTGSRGWGMYVASVAPGVFDVAAAAPDVIEATFGAGLKSPDGLTVHLFAADHPLDVTKRYYDVTGYPRLPARWALGPWLWRDENKDQAQVSGDVHAMRDLDLAHSALWIDRPYASGVNSFDWDPKMFTDAKAMIDEAHAFGFRMAIWHTPYVDPKDPTTKSLFDEATAKGFFPPVSVGIVKWGSPIDFTNPDAKAWWQQHLAQYTSMGIEGYKLDYAEEVVTGFAGARTKWKFHDGSDERTMHAGYGPLYHQTYQETLDPAGSFMLCRHGNPGDQVNVSVIWPGDLDASWARTGEKTLDQGGKPYNAVGGLPASLIAGLSLGPSGFPFYGADTGGYIHSPPDKELFTRWFQQTALSTVMQIGNSESTVAWEMIAPGFDAEMLDWYRTYTRLHLRLFPYVWSYATKLAVDGRPIARPLGLAYPDLGVHPNDTYLFGDHLLVAPVVDQGKTSRAVQFPPGEWIDWWTGERHTGGQLAMVAAPLERLPLFLRAGGIVPMLRPTIDTMSPTTATGKDKLGNPLVDSYATTPGILYPRLVAGDESTFTLFDGGTVGQKLGSAGLTLTCTSGNELALGSRFEVISFGAKPATVTLDGTALAEVADEATLETKATGWAFDPALGGRLLVKVGAGTHTVLAK
jgi:alpha-D-xyloside xylohydrolase